MLRLHYVTSQRPAEPQLLAEPLRYHLFLSHVWKTGANQMRISKERLRLLCPPLKGVPPFLLSLLSALLMLPSYLHAPLAAFDQFFLTLTTLSRAAGWSMSTPPTLCAYSCPTATSPHQIVGVSCCAPRKCHALDRSFADHLHYIICCSGPHSVTSPMIKWFAHSLM